MDKSCVEERILCFTNLNINIELFLVKKKKKNDFKTPFIDLVFYEELNFCGFILKKRKKFHGNFWQEL